MAPNRASGGLGIDREERAAIEEYGELVQELVDNLGGGEPRFRDRRVEAIDRAIRDEADAIRDYLAAVDAWQLEDGVRDAVAMLLPDDGRSGPPHLRAELKRADEQQQEKRRRVVELEDAAQPVLRRIAHLQQIREALLAKGDEADA